MNTLRWMVVVVVGGSGALAGCTPEPGADGDGSRALPGHSRPVLDHDWPHPADLAFEESTFLPPDPEEALLSLPSGARAYVVPDPEDPLVRVAAAIPLGSRFEGAGEEGAASLVARALDRQLVERLEGIAARSSVSEEPAVTTVSVDVLAEDREVALAAIVGALAGVVPSEIQAGRTGGPLSGGGTGRAVEELRRLVGSPPFAPPSEERVVPAEGARRLAREALDWPHVVIGVGGGATREEVESALRRAMADRPGSIAGAGAPSPSHPPASSDTRVPSEALHLIEEPGFMSWVAVGQAMAPIEPGDEAALAVMEEVVNVRLNIETREKRGLTNRALLVLPHPDEGAGLLYVGSSGRAESIAPLLRHAAEELSTIRTAAGAPSEREMADVRGGLILGRWQESLDGAREAARTYAREAVRRGTLEHLLGWPEAVEAVTAEDVIRVAGEYIDPAARTAVVVGQLEEVRAARHPRWPLTLDEAEALLRR